MRRLSSRATFFYKRVFPVLWIGIVAFVLFQLWNEVSSGRAPTAVLLAPVALLVIGFVVFRVVLFDLMDEVWDAGDRLIVRNGGESEEIPLAEIVNVSYAVFVNPPRVTLRVRRPTRFGSDVSSAAPARFVPMPKSPIIEDLIDRVDAARRRSSY